MIQITPNTAGHLHQSGRDDRGQAIYSPCELETCNQTISNEGSTPFGQFYSRRDGHDVSRIEVSRRYDNVLTVTFHSPNPKQRFPTVIEMNDYAWKALAATLSAHIEAAEAGEE